MDMKTISIPEQSLTVGTATYAEEGPFVAGVDPMIQVAAFNAGGKLERAIISNQSRLKAHAKCLEDDTFDPEIGEKIVREKLIIKDADRYEEKCDVLEQFLMNMLADIRQKSDKNFARKEAAKARLAALEGK